MSRKKAYICALSVLSLAGVLAALYATSEGVGAVGDSVVYVDAARHLLAGQGLVYTSPATGKTIPLTHFPPVYPALLALVGLSGIDLREGARWLNAVLFGANIFLFGSLIARYSRAFYWTAALGSLLILASVTMLNLHMLAMTEPFFLFLAFLGLFFLARYVENSRMTFLFASACIVGLAFLTRYPGMALVLTGGAALFFRMRKPFARRLVDSAVFVAIACLPVAVWLLRNAALAGTTTNRAVVFHPVGNRHLGLTVIAILDWILPGPGFHYPKLIFAVLLLISIYILRRERVLGAVKSVRQSIGNVPYFLKLLSLFIVVYIIFIAAARSFLDAAISFDGRMLSPMYVAGVIIAMCLLGRILRSDTPTRPGRAIPFALCLIFLTGAYLISGIAFVIRSHDDGVAYLNGETMEPTYAMQRWKQSETVKRLRSMPAGMAIFSNEPNAIYYLTGEPAASLPAKWDTITLRENPAYKAELAAMSDLLRERKAIVVYFYGKKYELFPSEEEIEQAVPLHALAKEPDGTIYEAAPAPSQ